MSGKDAEAGEVATIGRAVLGVLLEYEDGQRRQAQPGSQGEDAEPWRRASTPTRCAPADSAELSPEVSPAPSGERHAHARRGQHPQHHGQPVAIVPRVVQRGSELTWSMADGIGRIVTHRGDDGDEEGKAQSTHGLIVGQVR